MPAIVPVVFVVLL